MLRNTGGCLSRISVDGLFAAQDHIEPAQHLNRLRQNITGSIRIGTAKGAVGNEIRLIRSHGQRFPEHCLRLRRPHRNHGHFSAVAVLQLKACFQRIFIKRVHDTRHAGTNQRIFHRIDLDLSGIRNLFYTNNDIHLHSSYLYSLSNTPAIVILWIWFVPSKIWNTLQSLMSFSTGYSLL